MNSRKRIKVKYARTFTSRRNVIMRTILEIHEVRKSYHMGKVIVPALRGVSFDVEEGEILIDSFNILKLSDDKPAELRLTKMGFVFRFFNLLQRLTSLRNVELPLTIAGLPDKETSKRAKEMLKLVGLEGRMNHRPSELSGGEQQRVAMA